MEKEYIGPYKVTKVFKISARREIVERGLTREEAKRVVNNSPSSKNSMLVFEKQFSSEKYFK